MNETFKFQIGRRVFTYFAYLVKRHFARENNAFRALRVPEFRTLKVCVVCLRADVNVKTGRTLFCKRKHSGVGNNNRVGAERVNLTDKFGKFFNIVIVRDNVRRDIHFFAEIMGKIYALFNFVRSEIFCRNAERKFLAADINRVRAVDKRIF